MNDSEVKFVRHLGWAETSDGYVFYLQPDGSYTDGDLLFANSDDLLLNNPGTLLTFCGWHSNEKK